LVAEQPPPSAPLTVAVTAPTTPSITRRIAALPYEGLLLLALLLIATFPVSGMKGVTLSGMPHLLLQTYLALVVATYFTWFWRRGGQTLPMKTWRFRVVDRQHRPLTLKRALIRLAAASLFYGPACAGLVLLFFPQRVSPVITMWLFLPMLATLLWARFDTDRQFLHDRWAGTRLINASAEHGAPTA
jgi:uncharacterized RDD family membrane protein YckC